MESAVAAAVAVSKVVDVDGFVVIVVVVDQQYSVVCIGSTQTAAVDVVVIVGFVDVVVIVGFVVVFVVVVAVVE